MQSDDELFVSPVVVVTKAFPARPGSLPDAQDFVLESIELAEVETAEGHALYVAITDAILAAAGPDEGTFTVTVRLFPDGAEVEVLHGSDGPDAAGLGGWGVVRLLVQRDVAAAGPVAAGGSAAGRGFGAYGQPLGAGADRAADAGSAAGAAGLW